eukprot:5442170-Prymnesium_polylepis.1
MPPACTRRCDILGRRARPLGQDQKLSPPSFGSKRRTVRSVCLTVCLAVCLALPPRQYKAVLRGKLGVSPRAMRSSVSTATA